jgi:hypothetical protein
LPKNQQPPETPENLKKIPKTDQLAAAGHLAHPPEEHGGGVEAAVLEPTPFWVLA